MTFLVVQMCVCVSVCFVVLAAKSQGLFQSGWMASKGFTSEQATANLLTAHYAVLLGIMHAQQLCDSKWETVFISLATARNVCSLCGHGVLRSIAGGGEASCMTEAPLET